MQPDAFFAIQTPGGKASFFLELDRGTMESKRFKTKVAAYTGYYHSGAFNKRFGHKNFRVLTVVTTPTDNRVNTLLDASAKVERIGNRFWFAHKPDLTSKTILTDRVWKIAGTKETEAIFR